MENSKILQMFVVLALGFAFGYMWNSNSFPNYQTNTQMMPEGMMMQNSEMSMGSAMDDMIIGFAGLEGDAFDKTFLSQMIIHHEGAVVMAEAALKYAKHIELKTMANEIVSAQTREIEQMKNWQRSWYGQ